MDSDIDDDFDPLLRRRRQLRERKGRRRAILLITFASVIAVATVVVFSVTSPTVLVLRNVDPARRPNDLVEYFQQMGLRGTYSPKLASLINAKEGGEYSGAEFDIEVYRFEELSQAESLEKTGMDGMRCYRKGKLIMIIRDGEKKVLPLFQRF